jgi:signal transduction histidine kinase
MMWRWKEIAAISFHTGGIGRRLLVWNLSLFGLVLFGVVLASYLYSERQIKEDRFELQAEIASLVAARIETFVSQRVDRLSDLAVSMSLYPAGSKEQELLAILLLKNDRAFTDASILDSKGMELVKVSERRVYTREEFSDRSGAESFKKALEGNIYVSPVYTSDKAEPYVTLGVPLKATPQDTIGVLSAEANLKFLWEVIGNVHFGVAGYAYLVDGRGSLIAHKDPSLVLRRTNLGQIHEVQEFLSNPRGPDPTPADGGLGITGKPVLSTYAPLRGLGWAVVLEEPLDVALAHVRIVRHFALLLMAIGLSVGAVVIVWLGNRITRPIRQLHDGVKFIRSGNLDHQVKIKTADEIESLADDFNTMATELKGSHATLEQRVEQRTQELSALYDVTTTVNQSLELNPVLQEVIKKISGIFHFDATRIFLFDLERENLHLQASFETHPELWGQTRVIKRGQGINGKVGETGEPMIFEDVQHDSHYQQLNHTKGMHKLRLRFLALFPVKTKRLCVGTLLCAGQLPRRLTADEIQLLASMTNQIGVAVENASLFAAIRNKSTELEKANLELQEASRIKSEFMAAMSHELRTPLNIIMGNVELMKDRFFGEITQGQEKSLTQIIHHAHVLLKLINNVLTLTQIEAKKMSCEFAMTEVDEIVGHVKSYAEQLSRNGRLEIVWNVEPNLPPLTTDPVKLEEILQNLIGNAYKFTSKGKIEIRVRDLKDRGRVEFAVADTGMGIEKEDLEKIFEEFHQLKEAHTGHFDGFGLGLNIVKKYLALMQGDIRVESQPGIGSNFTFTLPYSF